MGRIVASVILLTASFGAAGCGFVEHLLGVPEAAPPLGEGLVDDVETLIDHGLSGDSSEPAGQCIPSETDEPCDDTVDEETPAVTVDLLAGIWVEAAYGSAAVHIGLDGSVRQLDLADVIAGAPLPAGVPRTLFHVGQLTILPDGNIGIDADLSLAGFSATGEGSGYIDPSLNAILGMTLYGNMTVLGAKSDLYIPDTVWLRWDPLTGEFPYFDHPS